MDKTYITPIEDLIAEDFGQEGTASRTEFEAGVEHVVHTRHLRRVEVAEIKGCEG